MEFGFDNKATEDEYEIGVGGSWIFFDRLQLGVDVPFGIRDPDVGSSESNVGDIEFSAKYLILAAPMDGVNLSLAASVAPPTGDRDKEIGGVGGWGVTALAGKLVDTGDSLPDIGVHHNLALNSRSDCRMSSWKPPKPWGLGKRGKKSWPGIWPSICLSSAADLSRRSRCWERPSWMPSIRVRKVLSWSLVADSGLTPLRKGEPLGPLAVGVAAKGPVTNRRESDFSILFVAKYEFE